MSNSHLNQINFTVFFFGLSKRRRKIFSYLWLLNRSCGGNVFPTVAKIAEKSGLSENAVQKFFNELLTKERFISIRHSLKITKRKNRMGGDSSNFYDLHPDFVLALNWIDRKRKMGARRKDAFEIASSMENSLKFYPPSPQFSTPSISYSYTKDIQTLVAPPPPPKTSVCVSPILQKYPLLDESVKIFATKNASEFEIVEALEACLWQEQEKRKRREKILNPSSYFYGVLKNKMKQRTPR